MWPKERYNDLPAFSPLLTDLKNEPKTHCRETKVDYWLHGSQAHPLTHDIFPIICTLAPSVWSLQQPLALQSCRDAIQAAGLSTLWPQKVHYVQYPRGEGTTTFY